MHCSEQIYQLYSYARSMATELEQEVGHLTDKFYDDASVSTAAAVEFEHEQMVAMQKLATALKLALDISTEYTL